MVRQGMQGSSSASSELTALQRLAAAGSEPLLAVGRALGAHLVHSLGSTTSVAITGGLGLIRLGLGAPNPHPPLPYTPCLCCTPCLGNLQPHLQAVCHVEALCQDLTAAVCVEERSWESLATLVHPGQQCTSHVYTSCALLVY